VGEEDPQHRVHRYDALRHQPCRHLVKLGGDRGLLPVQTNEGFAADHADDRARIRHQRGRTFPVGIKSHFTRQGAGQEFPQANRLSAAEVEMRRKRAAHQQDGVEVIVALAEHRAGMSRMVK
jgi:hypothetical protein